MTQKTWHKSGKLITVNMEVILDQEKYMKENKIDNQVSSDKRNLNNWQKITQNLFNFFNGDYLHIRLNNH